MRFVAVALLVACLVQGNNAQFGFQTLGSLVGSALSSAGSAIGHAASSPLANSAKTAVNCWLGWCNGASPFDENDDGAAGAGAGAGQSGAAGSAVIIGNMPGMESLSAASEGLLGSALSGMEEEELTVLADTLTLSEHLDTILAAQIAVSDQANGVANRLRTLVFGPVAATGCAKELVEEAKELTNNVTDIPTKANKLVKEGYFAHRECSEHSTPNSRGRCVAEKMVPTTIKSCFMVKDTNDFTMTAINTVKSLRRAFAMCAKQAKNAATAALMTAAVEEAAAGVAADIAAAANAATNAAAAVATKAVDEAAAVAKVASAAPEFVFQATAAVADNAVNAVSGTKRRRDD